MLLFSTMVEDEEVERMFNVVATAAAPLLLLLLLLFGLLCAVLVFLLLWVSRAGVQIEVDYFMYKYVTILRLVQ